ncbi:MAG: ABC transporter permease [Planctomycetota bacterium]|nr:MAG: ABC transporter permease [Planctomycetota bacterium]
MQTMLAIVKKELRTYFNSPIAYVFLLLFAGVALASFFQQIWALKQASLRPLFDVLPLILLLVVPALTMRLWSEERKLGTYEVLMTLPVRSIEAVLGKFLASLLLLALALVLTAGAAITVASLGPLDWGPVAGGYAAALFMGAAYLAVGLLVSAATDNQILAFLGALLVCFGLWAVGEEFFLRLWPQPLAETLAVFGTGARFRSIARGVLDLRDLVYYASVVVVCLGANVAILEARKER